MCLSVPDVFSLCDDSRACEYFHGLGHARCSARLVTLRVEGVLFLLDQTKDDLNDRVPDNG